MSADEMFEKLGYTKKVETIENKKLEDMDIRTAYLSGFCNGDKFWKNKYIEQVKYGTKITLEGEAVQQIIDIIKKDYISKDKIRKKLEEIQNEYFKILENNTLSLETQNYNTQRYEVMRNVLEELLEEEK